MSQNIIIVAGDPNSINSEIIFKTWRKLENKIRKKIYLIGNLRLINLQFKKLKYKIQLIEADDKNRPINSNFLNIIDIPLIFKDPFNVSTNESSKYVIKSLNLAHKLMLSKKYKGIINCPINKQLIKKSKIIGVTEYLASMCKVNNRSEAMMIHNKNLSVVPLTTHINIKDVSKNINSSLIIRKVTTVNKYFKKLFKKTPKIGVLGLNPHNGELIKNSEEIQKIIPALKVLKKKSVKIDGPLVADTLFIDNFKKYDVIVGMYHDQVLGPFKSMFHFNAINITLGLKYIRVSPDHGPAQDLIGKKKSNYLSLFKCVKFINNL